jgi:hypothetical protein
MKPVFLILFFCALTAPASTAMAQTNSPDAWKSSSLSYKMEEYGWHEGVISRDLHLAVSAGMMVATSNTKMDWSSKTQPNKPHDVHSISETSSIPLEDIDADALLVSTDKRGEPAFWQVHLTSKKSKSVKHNSTHDGQNLGVVEDDSLTLAYPDEDSAKTATHEIRALALQAQAPHK